MRRLLLFLGVLCMAIQLSGQGISIGPEVKMLALGDSYTIGESVPVEERWPHLLMSELRKTGIIAPDPDYIATTGWTTRNLLDGISLDLDKRINYNLVSILIGVNNQYQGLPFSLYEPELREIIDQALELMHGDASRVFIVSIPDYAYTPFGKANDTISFEIDNYNTINKSMAGEFGISWVNVTPTSRDGLTNPGLVAKDGLHPSGIQYREWVRKILLQVNFPKN
jgi:lysophospholipase L1-like esterase